MWRNLKFFHICHVEKFQIAPHDRCGEILNLSTSVMWEILKLLQMWRNFKFLQNTDVFCDLRYFVAHLFCRDLRAFVWRKFSPNFSPNLYTCGEKITNIRYASSLTISTICKKGKKQTAEHEGRG